jgi:two-component system NtrC family sensor kinase
MNDQDDTKCAGGCAAREESAKAELLRRNRELTELNEKLSRAQEQLLESEKRLSCATPAAD